MNLYSINGMFMPMQAPIQQVNVPNMPVQMPTQQANMPCAPVQIPTTQAGIPCMPMPKLATAYVPFQYLSCVFPPMQGLENGTIFPELARPYGVDPEFTVDA